MYRTGINILTLTCTVILALVLLVPASTLATTTASDFRVIVTNGNTIHDLNIKASEGPNGQVIPVSGFVINPEDVVLLKQGQNLVVMTSTNEPQRIEEVKLSNQAGQFIDIQPVLTSPGTWSLAGIAPGVYLLDVIVDTPDSDSRVAYETVLVILGPEQQPLPVAQYITMRQTVKVETDTNTKVIFKKSGCSDVAGSAKMGFPYENVSECQVHDFMECDKNNDNSDYCEDLEERFSDDCEGFKSSKECEDYWNNLGKPICDVDTPPGVTCIDEGDPDDCEPGFVDRGFGCEPEGEDPVICPADSTIVNGRCVPLSETIDEEVDEEVEDTRDDEEIEESEEGGNEEESESIEDDPEPVID